MINDSLRSFILKEYEIKVSVPFDNLCFRALGLH